MGGRPSVSVEDGGPSPDQASSHQFPDHVAANLRDLSLGEDDVTPAGNVFGELACEDTAVDAIGLLGQVPDNLRVEHPGVVLTVELHGRVVHVCLDVTQDFAGSSFRKEAIQVVQLAGRDGGVYQHPMAFGSDGEEYVVAQEHVA